MTSGYDVVVAGAGHNSLVAAAYLAKAGLRCLILESRPFVGGDTATEEMTLPSFHHDSCSTAHNLIQASPTLRNDELRLGAYGLEYLHPEPVIHVPFPDGSWLTQWRDVEATCAEFAKFSRGDAEAYRGMIADYDEIKGIYGAWRYTPIGWGPTLDERFQEHPEGRKWQRRRQMSAWEIIQDAFEDERSRAFMLYMASLTLQPPERPGTGMLAYSLPYGRQTHSWTLPRGGSGVLPQALARFIEDRGGTILTGRRVTGLVLEDGRCVGVETADGERHEAKRAVLSSVHVKHLVEMAPREAWGEDFSFGVDTWRPGLSMFVAHYATEAAPTFPAGDGEVVPVAAGIPVSVERLLRVTHDFHLGRVGTDDPPLLVLCPSVEDDTRAPEGKHTLKVIGFQPYELPEGPERWDDIEEEVAAANLDHLRRYAPNLAEEVILAEAVKSPLGLERLNEHNWHGSCHGGDQGPAQSGAMRPAPGWAQHRMPVPGLYQTGSTTHPGASVSAGPGRNSARVLLEDLGFDFEEVSSGA